MSNENAIIIIPRTLPEVSQLAEVLAQSNLMPKDLIGKPANVVVQILAGQELGLSPMAAIRGIHVFDGKPSLAADTMVGLVLASGLCEYFACVEDTDQRVTYETKRKGSPVAQRWTWTVEDTKRAGLQVKDNHRLYPGQMRKARCKAALARDVYPDILAGVCDPDELQVPVREQAQHVPSVSSPTSAPVADVEDAEIVESEVSNGLAAIAEATTVDALGVLAKTFATLKVSATGKAALLDAFKARKAALAAAEPQAVAS